MLWFRRTRGWSIVEALIALVLLAFGIYSAADVIMSARSNAARTERNLQATALANLKLEELRLGAPILVGSGLPSPLELPASGPGTFEQNRDYVWQARVEPADLPQTSTSLRLHVTVFRAGSSSPDGEAAGFWFATEATPAGGTT